MNAKRTILLIDDELDSLEPVQMLLEDDYAVFTAEGGEAALRLLENEAVDMVIADQRMPGMTGVELLARVRELCPEIVRLILTAYTDFEAMLMAINEGRVYRYIIKPWDETDMQVTIRQALEWKDLRASQGRLSAEIAEANRALADRNRQLEQAQETIIDQEKRAVVGRFAAEMAHEINNHLQIIMGVNETVTSTDEEYRKRIIQEQAQMLVWIASDIRDFAQGAAMPFTPRPVDPAAPVEQVLRACSYHPSFRSIELKLEKGPLTTFVMDPRQVKHLLFNLLKNAARATDGKGSITVQLAVDGDLIVRIVDHGSGIPADIKEKIWEPFFTTAEQNGAGLGLSICRHVVEMHGGGISCEDTPGGGTTFVVRLEPFRKDRAGSSSS
ncbi:MAG: hybrid sensor histidine kinase/response regulator [Deltaproteobacteria bacterium]|nr:hybrid sensor histidine kinase/response regulator [Deltaproteobacteria bacterium]